MTIKQQRDAELLPFHALITGANGGLGLALCARLAQDHLNLHPKQPIHLHFTTRSPSKAASVTEYLTSAFARHPRKSFLHLHSHTLDTSSPRSCLQLARSLPPINVAILNAGIGGFVGMDWPAAIWACLTDLVRAVTYGEFKLQAIGRVTKAKPHLGEVFATNVFGHYLICQDAPAIHRAVWISSLEAGAAHFDPSDLQGLKTEHAYESSKRLTDVMVLTGEEHGKGRMKEHGQQWVLAHPGIVATGIVDLHWILQWCMLIAFYIARWCGSGWHPIDAWKGAIAPVMLSVMGDGDVKEMKKRGVRKVGSGTDRWGNEGVTETDVQGGWENMGKDVWEQMERLREDVVEGVESGRYE
ncbi:hypothetical protein EX30DRAFT_313599 [Ascodesmis nigricans]|uniref:NAD(P)-binding protein n=1 Tax=Ascodesmis nigricans TaxID=341454 RepID=A0A4S2N6F5_9PEZI|nr:hypothetical protein EX30DRAFT_313599 [Ascodesmis nigricans]